jgi:hypothetical protein
VTRFKELRRIQNAIAHRDEAELRWALSYCALRKKYTKRRSDDWYRIEKQITAALAGLGAPELPKELPDSVSEARRRATRPRGRSTRR